MKAKSAKQKALSVANKASRAFSPTTHFEDYIKKNIVDGNEFKLVASKGKDGTIEFYIHPLGRDGETYDGYIHNYDVMPKKAIDNLMKYLRERQ